MSTGGSNPAGWYPQSDGSHRYWDGSTWTSQVIPPQPAYGAALAYFAPPSPQDGQPWPPIATSPGRYAVGPGSQPLIRYGGGAPASVAAKSPGLALAASFLVPGLGQLVNGEIVKGLVFVIAFLAGIVALVVLVGFLVVPVVWVWAMIDAYRSAMQWNQRYGIIA
ncbi:MAG: DUF2510 domain-containing protein [Dermatophilaceae bacterium]